MSRLLEEKNLCDPAQSMDAIAFLNQCCKLRCMCWCLSPCFAFAQKLLESYRIVCIMLHYYCGLQLLNEFHTVLGELRSLAWWMIFKDRWIASHDFHEINSHEINFAWGHALSVDQLSQNQLFHAHVPPTTTRSGTCLYRDSDTSVYSHNKYSPC